MSRHVIIEVHPYICRGGSFFKEAFVSNLYKIIVTGPFNSGKTAFISTISDIAVVTTERKITTEDRGIKAETTVAMDYGRVELDGKVLHLNGTPGQARKINAAAQKRVRVFSRGKNTLSGGGEKKIIARIICRLYLEAGVIVITLRSLFKSVDI